MFQQTLREFRKWTAIVFAVCISCVAVGALASFKMQDPLAAVVCFVAAILLFRVAIKLLGDTRSLKRDWDASTPEQRVKIEAELTS